MNMKLFGIILVRTLDRLIGKDNLVLFWYELLDRLIEKDDFEVVSYPTNNFFLCSLLDKNFGVILHRNLGGGYMIQLY